MIDVNEAIEGLQAALDAAKKLAPVAEALGMPAQVVAIVNVASVAADVAQNLAERVQDGKTVASAADKAEIRRIMVELRAENDRLAAAIARS